MLGSQMEAAGRNYVEAVKDTDIYKKYRCQLDILKKDPELYEKVNEFRRRNYEIQNTSRVDELFDKMEAFEKEYARFREDPVVDDFLRSELAFCRLMQELDLFITGELDFQ